jgi:hypothetical protein
MKRIPWITLVIILGLTVLFAQANSRQHEKPKSTSPTDDLYTGDLMHFGVTNNYGTIMPYQSPVGIEHLLVGNEIAGYTLSYLSGSTEYVAYSVYDESYNMNTGTYEDQISMPELRVRTVNTTANGVLQLQQNFTFRYDQKFILLESVITNLSASTLESVIYKISADWDVDNDYDDDKWDYDAINQLPYAYEQHYCTIFPLTPPPTYTDYDGWDDYNRRRTDVNMPPQYIEDFDGLMLHHYNLGNMAPGQTAYIAVVFATDNSPVLLGQQVYNASLYLAEPGVMEGHVYDMDNLIPLEGAVVTNSFYGISDTTDSFGYYSLPRMPAGNQLISAVHQGYYISNQLVRLTPGDTTVYDFLMEQVINTYLDVTLTPHGTPIVIPQSGGSFNFELSISNTFPQSQTIDLWSYILLPGGGMVGPIIHVYDYSIAFNTTLTKNILQMVPTTAPPGVYQYFACIGEHPWIVAEVDSFTFTKSGGYDSQGSWTIKDWSCSSFQSGDPASDNGETSHNTLSVPGITPNPFNPSTAISYQLSALSFVNLSVYDVAGKKVAELVNGAQNAGSHEVIFDGSGLPSGIYLYRLTSSGSGATPTMATGKMVLLK